MRNSRVLSTYVTAVCAAMTFTTEALRRHLPRSTVWHRYKLLTGPTLRPRCTHSKLQAGDVGLLAGGLYLNVQIKPINSGDPDLPITYHVAYGTVQLRRSSYLAQGGIRLDKVSHIKIIGDIDIVGEAEYKNSKWRYGIEFLHSHHIFIDGVKNRNILFTGLRIGENKDDTDTQWIDIKNVLVDRVCPYNMYPWVGVYNDSGYSIYN